jgi:N-sulfoglucosamine sulfohydrolase
MTTGLLLSSKAVDIHATKDRPNFLLITADDLNFNSCGIYGCTVPDITPNIDKLAADGVKFDHGHVTIAVCQPSRSVLMTGKYPHRNGAEGFQPIDDTTPTLQEYLHNAGYLNGIMAKNSHLKPVEKFFWDYYIEGSSLGRGRSPSLFYDYAKTFFQTARDAGRQFFLMANSQDPHRPFAGSQQEMDKWGESVPFDRQITTAEAEIPGFLPELPDVRQEIAEYFTSVHRCDQIVGEVLRALDETGYRDNTLVMFLSDNGMALPFAKTNCYLNSTQTPWLARWPGVINPGTIDSEHFISGIDYMPTILKAARLDGPNDMDGNSFLPVLYGRGQKDRESVVTVFHETSGKKRFEMRCVQNKNFGYIYNAWSDGQTEFKNESQSGLTMDAMEEAALTDPNIAARVNLFLYRVPEELYNFATDPDALNNLIDDPSYATQLEKLKSELLAWMEETKDPLKPTFEQIL